MWCFCLGRAPHKVDLLIRPANSYKTPAKLQMYAHTHTHPHPHPHTHTHGRRHTHTHTHTHTHGNLDEYCIVGFCKNALFYTVNECMVEPSFKIGMLQASMYICSTACNKLENLSFNAFKSPPDMHICHRLNYTS